MAKQPNEDPTQYNPGATGDTSQRAIDNIGKGLGKHPVNNPEFFGFSQEGRKDGKVIDWTKVPLKGIDAGEGRVPSVDEGMRSGLIQDPRYYFSGQGPDFMAGATQDGVTPPQFAPTDVPEEYFSDPPRTMKGYRELAAGSGAPPELGGPSLVPENTPPLPPDASMDEFYADPRVQERMAKQKLVQPMRERVEELDRQADKREQEQRDLAEASRPDILKTPAERGVRPAVGPPSPTPEPGSVGPPSPEQATGPTKPSEADARREQKQQEQERSNQLATERTRARRGLPPLNEEARAAISSPEAMRAFRSGPAPSQDAGDPRGGQQPGQPSQAPSGPPEGGYRTGQQVDLSNIPGGQSSTMVYAIGDGLALPDASGMGTDSFVEAFKQVNPGKNPTDAVRALSREPGPAGAAARKILRDIGATGGASLSAAQKEQLEDQMGENLAVMLREYSRSQSGNIASGSRAIETEKRRQQKEDEAAAEARKKEEEDIRKSAMSRAESRYKSGDEVGRSMDDILAQEIEREKERRAFIAGEAGTYSVDTDFEGMDVTASNRAPASVPPGAMPSGASFDSSGGLVYNNENLPKGGLTAVFVEDFGKVVPVVNNDREARALPPGQAFMRDGKFYPGKGVSGRPSKGGGTTSAARSGSRAADTGEDIGASLNRTRETLEREQEKKFNDANSTTMSEIEEARERLRNGNFTEGSGGAENLKALIAQKEADLAAARENQIKPITDQEIVERVEADRAQQRTDAKTGEDILFREGDPAVFGKRAQAQLSEGTDIQITAGGPAMSVGGTQMPAAQIGDSYIPNPQTSQQIAALEGASKNNVFTASMGEDEIGIVGSDTYKESSEIRQGLVDLATEDPEAFIRNPNEVMKEIDGYITSKYPDVPTEQRPAIAKAIAESVGLRTENFRPEELEQRRQEAGVESGGGAEAQFENIQNTSSTIALRKDAKDAWGYANKTINNNAANDYQGFYRDAFDSATGVDLLALSDADKQAQYDAAEDAFSHRSYEKNLTRVSKENPDIPFEQRQEMALEGVNKDLFQFEEEARARGIEPRQMRQSGDESIERIRTMWWFDS